MSAPATVESPGACGLAETKRGDRVREMFSAIAPTYDRLNHLLSLNRDRAWRRAAIQMLAPQPHEAVLDLCGGTGDLALECITQQSQSRVIVADFSVPMLRLAQTKVPATAALQAADALRLPYREGAFDAVIVAFGVRNFERTEEGVREMARVLRPGGRLVALEFFKPCSPLMAFVFGEVFRRALPLVGRAISGHPSAYAYLPESVGSFVTRPEFEHSLRGAGFDEVTARDLDFGIASVVVAKRVAR